MLLRRQFRYCVTSLADVGEESITTQYSLSQWPPRLVERLNCSMYYTEIPFTFCCPFGARQKIIFFRSFLVISFHFHDDDQNYTHTYEKRSNEISNVRTFGASVPGWGSSSRTSVVLWLVLRKKLRLLATRSSHAEKEEHEAALGSSSLERNLARCFCFGFPSIFSIFCLSFPTRLEAQTMEIHLLHYWCISPLILASNLSLEFE